MAIPRYAPMLTAPTDSLPVSDRWVYEPKLNGWRMLAYESMEQWFLFTRGGLNYTDNFPQIAEQLPAALNGSQAVLDGEIVALDKRNRERRQLMLRQSAARIIYYVFDILEFDDTPLVHEPWRNRRQLLEEVVKNQPNIILTDYYEHADLDFLKRAAKLRGMEGIIAKRKDSSYKPNSRSKDGWLKYRFPPYARASRRSLKTTGQSPDNGNPVQS